MEEEEEEEEKEEKSKNDSALVTGNFINCFHEK